MDTFGDQCRDQDLAKPMIMSVTSLLANQHIALESQCVSTCTWSVSCSSTHAGQCSFSFLTRVSRNCIYFTAIGNAVVSVIAVYRLTDNLRPLLDLANIRLFTDLITSSARLPSQTAYRGTPRPATLEIDISSGFRCARLIPSRLLDSARSIYGYCVHQWRERTAMFISGRFISVSRSFC